MKKILALLLLCAIILPSFLFLSGSVEVADVTVSEPAEPETELLPEEEETEEAWKERFPYDLSGYITIPSPLGVEAKFEETGICTEEERNAVVDQIRLAFATFEEKEGGVVERFDKVILSIQVVLEGELLGERTREGASIVIGSEDLEAEDRVLATALVGASVGEMRWADYTYPEGEEYGELSGKTVVAKGIVSQIQKANLPEVTEDFLHQMRGYETATVEEFYAGIEADILQEKENAKIEAVWTTFAENAVVSNYPEAELEQYQKDYLAYYTAFAKSMEMSLSDFLEEYLDSNEEIFKEEMLSYAREMVKNDMIFTCLIRELGVTLSEEEYAMGLQKYFDNEETAFESLEEYEEYYTKQTVWENLLRDKALMTMVEHAVRVE